MDAAPLSRMPWPRVGVLDKYQRLRSTLSMGGVRLSMDYIENSAINRRLAILSLDAAQEIDRRLSGERPDYAILRQLGKRLSKLSGLADAQPRAFLHSDPATTEIFAQAAGATKEGEISDIDELTVVMRDIVSPLMTHEADLPPEALILLKTFCLAFHRSIMALRQSAPNDDESAFENEFGFI